tara:strand:+ start:646 stop:1068 length:423 start_codon:yes stop_codon:yes gene_type:complete
MTNIEITQPPKQIRVLYKPKVNIHSTHTTDYQYLIDTNDIENDTFYRCKDDAQKIIDEKADDVEGNFLNDEMSSYDEDIEITENRSEIVPFRIEDLNDKEVKSFLQSNSMYELIKTDNDCFFQLKDEFMKQTYPNETSIN